MNFNNNNISWPNSTQGPFAYGCIQDQLYPQDFFYLPTSSQLCSSNSAIHDMDCPEVIVTASECADEDTEPVRNIKAFQRRGKSGNQTWVHESGTFKCQAPEGCSEVYEKASQLREHIYREHAPFVMFQCRDCGRPYTMECTYKRHKKAPRTSKGGHRKRISQTGTKGQCKPKQLTQEEKRCYDHRQKIQACFSRMDDQEKVREGFELIEEGRHFIPGKPHTKRKQSKPRKDIPGPLYSHNSRECGEYTPARSYSSGQQSMHSPQQQEDQSYVCSPPIPVVYGLTSYDEHYSGNFDEWSQVTAAGTEASGYAPMRDSLQVWDYGINAVNTSNQFATLTTEQFATPRTAEVHRPSLAFSPSCPTWSGNILSTSPQTRDNLLSSPSNSAPTFPTTPQHYFYRSGPSKTR